MGGWKVNDGNLLTGQKAAARIKKGTGSAGIYLWLTRKDALALENTAQKHAFVRSLKSRPEELTYKLP